LSVPSFDQLLVRLVEADIRFVVIGGLALGSWCVIRGTKDCDIVPDPAPENLDRLARLVADLGGHVQLGESLLGSERSIAALLRSASSSAEGFENSLRHSVFARLVAVARTQTRSDRRLAARSVEEA
jgi:hypothetical protein